MYNPTTKNVCRPPTTKTIICGIQQVLELRSFLFLKKWCILKTKYHEVGINPKNPCKINVKFSKIFEIPGFFVKIIMNMRISSVFGPN